jgi:hypothetical protein
VAAAVAALLMTANGAVSVVLLWKDIYGHRPVWSVLAAATLSISALCVCVFAGEAIVGRPLGQWRRGDSADG